MNNLKNLYPCLDSIRKHTTISYEILVVAYLFSEENLLKLRADYPCIMIIESNEIMGFSENNNLALRKAKGDYCFVLNDDTFFNTPVIDELICSIENLPENVAFISPNIKYPDNTDQYCGRNKITWFNYFLDNFKLWNEKKSSKYINQTGIFKSYNIVGACFLVKTNVLKKLSYFDESYFFCPEDIALSTKANDIGYECYVNSNVILYHIGGGSGWSPIITATRPSGIKGNYLFLTKDNLLAKIVLGSSIFMTRLIYGLFWMLKSTTNPKVKLQAKACFNVCKTIFSKLTPKEIFIKYYNNGKL